MIPELLGFWTLSIVWNSKYQKKQRFGNWICFRLQVRGKGHLLCWVCYKELNSSSGQSIWSQSASQSWCPSWTRDHFFFLLEIFFRQSRVCYFVVPYLTRRRVCNLMLLLVLTSTVPLGSESCRTQDHILLPQFLRLPQPGGPGPRIYIPQEHWAPCPSPLTTRTATVEVFYPKVRSKVKVII
jgi:hypothetical protein